MNTIDLKTKKKFRKKIHKIKKAKNGEHVLPPIEKIYPKNKFRKTVKLEPRTDILTKEYFYNKNEDLSIKEGSKTTRDPHKRPKNSVLIIVKKIIFLPLTSLG